MREFILRDVYFSLTSRRACCSCLSPFIKSILLCCKWSYKLIFIWFSKRRSSNSWTMRHRSLLIWFNAIRFLVRMKSRWQILRFNLFFSIAINLSSLSYTWTCIYWDLNRWSLLQCWISFVTFMEIWFLRDYLLRKGRWDLLLSFSWEKLLIKSYDILWLWSRWWNRAIWEWYLLIWLLIIIIFFC